MCIYISGAIDEKRELEGQISDLVEELANERIELDRYKTLLENEKGKVLELQQLHKAEDKSELEQLVENTRYDLLWLHVWQAFKPNNNVEGNMIDEIGVSICGQWRNSQLYDGQDMQISWLNTELHTPVEKWVWHETQPATQIMSAEFAYLFVWSQPSTPNLPLCTVCSTW